MPIRLALTIDNVTTALPPPVAPYTAITARIAATDAASGTAVSVNGLTLMVLSPTGTRTLTFVDMTEVSRGVYTAPLTLDAVGRYVLSASCAGYFGNDTFPDTASPARSADLPMLVIGSEASTPVPEPTAPPVQEAFESAEVAYDAADRAETALSQIQALIGGLPPGTGGQISAAQRPTSGTWSRGQFVWNSVPAVFGGRILAGWLRLTTGSAHVPGVDWQDVFFDTVEGSRYLLAEDGRYLISEAGDRLVAEDTVPRLDQPFEVLRAIPPELPTGTARIETLGRRTVGDRGAGAYLRLQPAISAYSSRADGGNGLVGLSLDGMTSTAVAGHDGTASAANRLTATVGGGAAAAFFQFDLPSARWRVRYRVRRHSGTSAIQHAINDGPWVTASVPAGPAFVEVTDHVSGAYPFVRWRVMDSGHAFDLDDVRVDLDDEAAFADADGAVWRLDERIVLPEHFGAFIDADAQPVDHADRIRQALAYVAEAPERELHSGHGWVRLWSGAVEVPAYARWDSGPVAGDQPQAGVEFGVVEGGALVLHTGASVRLAARARWLTGRDYPMLPLTWADGGAAWRERMRRALDNQSRFVAGGVFARVAGEGVSADLFVTGAALALDAPAVRSGSFRVAGDCQRIGALRAPGERVTYDGRQDGYVGDSSFLPVRRQVEDFTASGGKVLATLREDHAEGVEAIADAGGRVRLTLEQGGLAHVLVGQPVVLTDFLAPLTALNGTWTAQEVSEDGLSLVVSAPWFPAYSTYDGAGGTASVAAPDVDALQPGDVVWLADLGMGDAEDGPRLAADLIGRASVTWGADGMPALASDGRRVLAVNRDRTRPAGRQAVSVMLDLPWHGDMTSLAGSIAVAPGAREGIAHAIGGAEGASVSAFARGALVGVAAAGDATVREADFEGGVRAPLPGTRGVWLGAGARITSGRARGCGVPLTAGGDATVSGFLLSDGLGGTTVEHLGGTLTLLAAATEGGTPVVRMADAAVGLRWGGWLPRPVLLGTGAAARFHGAHPGIAGSVVVAEAPQANEVLADFDLPYDVAFAPALADWTVRTDTAAAGTATYRLMLDGVQVGTVSVAGSSATLACSGVDAAAGQRVQLLAAAVPDAAHRGVINIRAARRF